MTINDILLRAVARRPDKVGVIDGERSFTYGQVHDRVRALAAFLADRGLRRGDRVSILAPNSAAFLEAYFAAARDGLILNPWNTRLSSREIRTIAEDAGPRFLVAHSVYLDTVRDLLAHRSSIEGVLWTGDDVLLDAALPQFRYEEVVSAETGDDQNALEDDTAIAQLYYTSGTKESPAVSPSPTGMSVPTPVSPSRSSTSKKAIPGVTSLPCSTWPTPGRPSP